MIDVEVGADSPVVRAGIMVLFEEQPASRWAVGGRFDDAHVASGGRLLISARVMAGVWTQERIRLLIERFAQALRDALQLGEAPDALGSCWVLLEQIKDGSWGAFGGPVSILDILELGGFTPDRQADARAFVERG